MWSLSHLKHSPVSPATRLHPQPHPTGNLLGTLPFNTLSELKNKAHDLLLEAGLSPPGGQEGAQQLFPSLLGPTGSSSSNVSSPLAPTVWETIGGVSGRRWETEWREEVHCLLGLRLCGYDQAWERTSPQAGWAAIAMVTVTLTAP